VHLQRWGGGRIGRMRLFVDLPLAPGAAFALPPAAARHAQVRRAQPGDALVLFDGRGGEWPSVVVSMGRAEVQVCVQHHDAVERESALPVMLAVGMPANERMDWLVEKATELGAVAIQPLHCERSVLRLDSERAERKRTHWQAVAVAAAEQSGRTRVPVLHPARNLRQWLAQPLPAGPRWLLSLAPGAAAPQHLSPPAQAVVLSGPEGGLTAEEAAAARAAGFVDISLGERVLRADTAPLAALAWLVLTCWGPSATG